MTTARLAEIEARLQAIGSDSWIVNPADPYEVSYAQDPNIGYGVAQLPEPGVWEPPGVVCATVPYQAGAEMAQAHGQFIAHSPEDIRDLLAEVRRLRGEQ